MIPRPLSVPSSRALRPVTGALMFRVFVLALFLAFLPVAGFGNTPEGPVSPLLQKALDHPRDLGLEKGAPVAVWVFFTDKGLDAAALDRALQQAREELSPRAVARRGRMAGPGAPVVDARDLPLAPDDLAEVVALGGKLRHVSRWLNAASFDVAPDAVAKVAALPMVRRVDLVRRFRKPRPLEPNPVDLKRAPDGPGFGQGPPEPGAKSAQQALWTLDYGLNRGPLEQIDVPAVHEMGVTGRGVVVGMLDTGFRTTHESLAGVPVLGAFDFVDNDSIVDLQEGDLSSVINHGTMTLSTVAGYMPGQLIAPAYGVSVLLARTEDVSQEVPAEEDHWVAGLEWAEAQGADIISSSLGYIDWYTFADLDGNTAVTTVAADLAVGRGLVVVNSAGNSRTTTGTLIAPADGDSVITAGAVDITGVYTYFSSPGPTADGRIKPDVMALGQDNPVANPTDDHGYGFVSGTSFSCPLTSGVVALMLSRVPGLTPMEVREALRQTANNAATPDNDYGWGIIDAYAAVTYYGPVFQTSPLGDTEDTSGPYPVTAVVTGRTGVDPASVTLRYRVNGGGWSTLPMSSTGNADEFGADIPGQSLGSTVEYYLAATGTDGFTTTWPVYGADEPARFQVTALVDLAVSAAPALVIPMDDPAGVSSVIDVTGAQSGIVVDVSVDVAITHPDIGELTLLLTSPMGTQVTLHLQSDAGTADLVGNYPQTLTVDGPGNLTFFHDEPSIGPWTLTAIDALVGNNGVLESWGLNFVLKDFVSAGGDAPRALAELNPNYPNPFNPSTFLRLALSEPAYARLEIYDLTGQRVRLLASDWWPAGRHTVPWDGTDDGGTAVASGPYFVHLTTGGAVQVRKVMLVR